MARRLLRCRRVKLLAARRDRRGAREEPGIYLALVCHDSCVDVCFQVGVGGRISPELPWWIAPHEGRAALSWSVNAHALALDGAGLHTAKIQKGTHGHELQTRQRVRGTVERTAGCSGCTPGDEDGDMGVHFIITTH